MTSNRGGSTHPSDITFRSEQRGNPEGRGGSTHDPTRRDAPATALGTKATNPTSPTGKPTGDQGRS